MTLQQFWYTIQHFSAQFSIKVYGGARRGRKVAPMHDIIIREFTTHDVASSTTRLQNKEIIYTSCETKGMNNLQSQKFPQQRCHSWDTVKRVIFTSSSRYQSSLRHGSCFVTLTEWQHQLNSGVVQTNLNICKIIKTCFRQLKQYS